MKTTLFPNHEIVTRISSVEKYDPKPRRSFFGTPNWIHNEFRVPLTSNEEGVIVKAKFVNTLTSTYHINNGIYDIELFHPKVFSGVRVIDEIDFFGNILEVFKVNKSVARGTGYFSPTGNENQKSIIMNASIRVDNTHNLFRTLAEHRNCGAGYVLDELVQQEIVTNIDSILQSKNLDSLRKQLSQTYQSAGITLLDFNASPVSGGTSFSLTPDGTDLEGIITSLSNKGFSKEQIVSILEVLKSKAPPIEIKIKK